MLSDTGRLLTGGCREGPVILQLSGKAQDYRQKRPHIMGDAADSVGAGSVLFGNKSSCLVELSVDLRKFSLLREAGRRRLFQSLAKWV